MDVDRSPLTSIFFDKENYLRDWYVAWNLTPQGPYWVVMFFLAILFMLQALTVLTFDRGPLRLSPQTRE